MKWTLYLKILLIPAAIIFKIICEVWKFCFWRAVDWILMEYRMKR